MIGILRPGQRQSGRASLIANTLGRAWALLANGIMFPIYLRMLGQESFGIVAILSSIIGIIALFDFGLTPVFARELHHQARDRQSRLDLLFSAEVLFLAIVLAISLAAWLLPTDVVSALVKDAASQAVPVADALRGAFTLAAVQLMFNFYISALSGIEAQVESNLVSIGTSLLRSVGVVLPLLVSPTIEVFLLWQLVTTGIGLLIARFILYRLLSAGRAERSARFSLREVRGRLPAAWASFLLAIAATLNMNLDKILVGRFEGLVQVAEYGIAATFAQLIFIASVPISMTVTPRMVRAITGEESGAFERLLTMTRSSIGVITGILFVVSCWHGSTLIEHWSGGSIASEAVGQYVAWLFIGSACLALSAIYHCIATAHLDFSFGQPYVLSLLLIIPLYWLAIEIAGIRGAAIAWGCVQLMIMVAYMIWVSRRLLRGRALQALPWAGFCVGAAASVIACILFSSWQRQASGFVTFGMITLSELALAAVLVVVALVVLHRRWCIDDALAASVDSWIRKIGQRQSKQ